MFLFDLIVTVEREADMDQRAHAGLPTGLCAGPVDWCRGSEIQLMLLFLACSSNYFFVRRAAKKDGFKLVSNDGLELLTQLHFAVQPVMWT